MFKKVLFAFLFLIFNLVFAGPAHLTPLFGPTQACDDLWTISAELSRQDQAILQQTMVALLHANPEAFYKNNINGLLKGYLLKIPSAEDIGKITKAYAINFVKTQNASWQKISSKIKTNPQILQQLVHQDKCPKPNKEELINRFHDVEFSTLVPVDKKIMHLRQVIFTLNKQNNVMYSKQKELHKRNDMLIQSNSALQKNNQILKAYLIKTENKMHDLQTRQQQNQQMIMRNYQETFAYNIKVLHYAQLVMLGMMAIFLLWIIAILLSRLGKKAEKPVVKTSESSSPINYNSLSGEDVFTTKLDLARAYIEMEDFDHAKEVLESVLKDGNKIQKAEAKELQKQLK